MCVSVQIWFLATFLDRSSKDGNFSLFPFSHCRRSCALANKTFHRIVPILQDAKIDSYYLRIPCRVLCAKNACNNWFHRKKIDKNMQQQNAKFREIILFCQSIVFTKFLLCIKLEDAWFVFTNYFKSDKKKIKNKYHCLSFPVKHV